MNRIVRCISLMVILTGVACVLSFSGCPVRTPETYEKAIQLGRKDILAVRQVERLYGAGYHFITYYDGRYGTPEWNSQVGLFKRYILQVSVPITVDHSGTHVTPQKEPRFYVWEKTSIERGQSGTLLVLFGDDHLEFGLKEWERVVEAKGDLRVLGLKMKEDQPLEHFDESFGPR
jgi:hypothetical protein